MIQCGLHAIVSSVHTFIPSLALVTVTSAHTLSCKPIPKSEARRGDQRAASRYGVATPRDSTRDSTKEN